MARAFTLTFFVGFSILMERKDPSRTDTKSHSKNINNPVDPA